MPFKKKHPESIIKKKCEASFSLLETVIALGLMVTVILEVSSIQGKSITFNEYNRKVNQASWLAQSVLAQVERGYKMYNFKEIKSDVKDQEFSEALCSKDPSFDCDFKYDLKIEPFSLNIVDLISKQLLGGGSEDDEEGSDIGGFGDVIESQIKNLLGDEILKIAHIEVFWPEGSSKNSVNFSYLMTNQNQLDEQIFMQKPLLGSKKDKAKDSDKSKIDAKNKKLKGAEADKAHNSAIEPIVDPDPDPDPDSDEFY